jgi:agmatine deiminase
VDGYTLVERGTGPEAYEQVKPQQAAVANGVVQFEPVLMLVRPEQVSEARKMLSSSVELLEAQLDDAWVRDNGPIFVRDAGERIALVQFGFNAWGEVFDTYAFDAKVPEVIASHLGVKRYVAPMVLEGGSFFVDGDGTAITTEQCLLNENRNPDMNAAQIESTLRDYLGVEKVIWLGEGHYDDSRPMGTSTTSPISSRLAG